MNPVVEFRSTDRLLTAPGRVNGRPRLRSTAYKPTRLIPKADDHRRPGAWKNPSPEAVKVQLSKILESDGFVHAERMRRFLEFVVNETLSGRARKLCEYSVGISVYKRHESFDPSFDPIVRNDARRLRQKLLEHYHRSRNEGGEQVIIEVPKGGYIPIFDSVTDRRNARAEGQYRLTVNLIRVADGTEIWAREYELKDSQNFKVQLEIAKR